MLYMFVCCNAKTDEKEGIYKATSIDRGSNYPFRGEWRVATASAEDEENCPSSE